MLLWIKPASGPFELPCCLPDSSHPTSSPGRTRSWSSRWRRAASAHAASRWALRSNPTRSGPCVDYSGPGIIAMPGAGLFRVRSFSCLQTAVCRNVSRHSQAVFPDGSSMGTNYPTHTSSSAYIWTPASPTRVTRARTAQIGVANQRGCRLQPMASKTPDWRSRQESGTKTMPGGCGGEVPESAIMGLR